MPAHPYNLIGGPYLPPPLKKGRRAYCLYRDAEVVVTAWTDAPISWPRCRALASRGWSGLLVTEELRRAILTESASALRHWFGVGERAVWSWRRTFGVGQWGSVGSRLSHQAASERGAARTRGKSLSASVRATMRAAAAQRSDLAALLALAQAKRWAGRGWTADQLAVLGTMSDDEVAAKTGRSANAVRVRRVKLRIPPFDPPPTT